jgi:quinate dehydrogenase (quinone)
MLSKKIRRTDVFVLQALGVVIALFGLCMLGGGVYLISLGGSWYFAPAGLVLLAAGGLIGRRYISGAALYMLFFGVTVVWSLLDSGMDFWPLFSRLFVVAVLAFLVLLLMPAFRERGAARPRRPFYLLAGVFAIGLGATLYAMLQQRPVVMAKAAPTAIAGAPGEQISAANWPYFGRTPSGTRYAPLEQITPENVNRLKVAWTYRTGDIPDASSAHVVTPLHIDGTLYGCTQSSRLFALDAETGVERWTFDSHSAKNKVFPRCRGVAYHDAGKDAVSVAAAGFTPAPAATAEPSAACTRRIIATTVDARIVAVDAATGKSCADFGDHGAVSLQTGMDNPNPELYFPTAAPTVVRNLIVVGGLVWDNQKVGEPSGVVRAFDVRTGALVWAWDLGNPAITTLPPAGSSYTPGTPNVWSIPSFDEKLGLVYLPTGNSTPDFWGGHRSAESDRYSSSIVALDIATGRERWKFQTVHHDLWDYDVPSQPALYDVPDGRGGIAPALIQTTKRGEIFMLDRRTGKPIATVEERPVPQGGMPDDRLSATQPFSTGMPSIGTEPLSEQRMWGVSLLDQLVCRIDFRKSRYEGIFTPPSERQTIQYPSWLGGMNWGSVSIAENLGYLIVNDTRVAVTNKLVRRAEYDRNVQANGGHEGSAPQAGTPWGVEQSRFLSPLGIPCQQPPYGTLTAIDLATRQVAWSIPLGTTEETGPLGIATHLPIPIGMPTRGGPITTSSGLIFIAASQDFRFRAVDVRTGQERWHATLPVGAEATPMTYLSPRSRRQFVAISAGGNSATAPKGDYIVAFALPR